MRLIDADALEDMYFDIVDVDKEPLWVIDKDEIDDAPTVCDIEQIRAEIDRQEKWLLQAGYTAYNVDIAFDSIKYVLAESEDKK